MKATNETNGEREIRIIRNGEQKGNFRDKIARNAAFRLTKARTKGNFTRKRVCQVDRFPRGNEFHRGELLHPGVRGLAYRFVIRDYSIRKAGGERSGGECGSSRATSSREGR